MSKVKTYVLSVILFILLVALLVLERLYPTGGLTMLQEFLK